MPAEGQFCGNCYFAFPADPDGETVNCARLPPTPYLDHSPGGPIIRAMFPAMKARGWCGEWQQMGASN